MSQHKTSPDHELTGYPPGVPYIIGNEGCERFSFYGMRAILYVYIVGLFINLRGLAPEVAKIEATQAYHVFGGFVYLTPLVGGIIADRLLGKYHTILYLSVVYCLGHLCLALFEDPQLQLDVLGSIYLDPIAGLYLGLGLIAIGGGGIKPCVSAHVGDQFGRGNWHLLQKIFNAFYFIINFGSAFATLIIPAIRGELVEKTINGQLMYTYEGSVGWAFGIPGILMGLATIAFWMGRKVFIHVPPTTERRLAILDVLGGAALAAAFGLPTLFHDAFPSVGVSLMVSAGCVAAWAALFFTRQKMAVDDGFLAVLLYSFWAKVTGGGPAPSAGDEGLKTHAFFGPAARRFGEEAADGTRAVLRIMLVFLWVAVFWAIFDQHSSTWIEQATRMNREVSFGMTGWIVSGLIFGGVLAIALYLTLRGPRRIPATLAGLAGGLALGLGFFYIKPTFTLQASQVPAANPYMVMILVPYTTFGLYPWLRKIGWDPHPLRRMTVGMFMAGVSFVAIAIIQRFIDAAEPGSVHVGWQLIPYGLLTLSEVMVSITGLEFAYSQAPKRMKSIIMGFWLLTVTLGNLLVALVAGFFEQLDLEVFFWVFAAQMAVAGTIFGILASRFEYRDQIQ